MVGVVVRVPQLARDLSHCQAEYRQKRPVPTPSIFSLAETHKDLLTWHPRLLPAVSHFHFIPIHRRTVEMAIAHSKSSLDCIFYFMGFGEL